MKRKEWVSGNIFIRETVFDQEGERADGHSHNFDHTTIIMAGAIHVKAKLPNGDVKQREFTSGQHFLVRADVHHEVTALAANTCYWCVFSHRDPQGEIVQQFTGWERGYQ